ncbi:MAG: hypothetical protein LBR67_08800 [Dysgonamonadaceae bacterium]|jgi:LEA14-like dessication related protein|nr:hypothetical protein [Dysgonamonadaceae bacterium]
MKKIIVLVSFVLVWVGCDVAKNLAGTYSLMQCQYKYNSISNINLSGVSVKNVNSLTAADILSLTGLIKAFSGSTIPLQFTLNLDVTNPNYQPAILNTLQYILEIDNIEMTTGTVDSKMQIATGQIAQLPVNIAFDLKKAMKNETLDAVKTMALNFVGLGDRATNVTIKLKPSLDIGGQQLVSPIYIPVTFSYGKTN